MRRCRATGRCGVMLRNDAAMAPEALWWPLIYSCTIDEGWLASGVTLICM